MKFDQLPFVTGERIRGRADNGSLRFPDDDFAVAKMSTKCWHLLWRLWLTPEILPVARETLPACREPAWLGIPGQAGVQLTNSNHPQKINRFVSIHKKRLSSLSLSVSTGMDFDPIEIQSSPFARLDSVHFK